MVSKLASDADLGYNLSRNIVVPEDAVNTFRRVANLFWRSTTLDTLSPHADNGNPSEKRCSTCRNFYPATPEYFHRQKSSKDGFKTLCKQCQKEYQATYNATHREKLSEQHKIYYQARSEHLRQYSAQYRAEHPEEVRQSNARYNEEHKEQRRLFKARYNAAHREERRVYRAKWHEDHREHERQYSAEYNAEHHDERLTYGRWYRVVHREEMSKKRKNYRRTDRGRRLHTAHENNRRARKLSIPGIHTPEQIREQYDRQKGKCYYCHHKIKWGQHHVDHTFPVSREHARNSIDHLVITCKPCNLKKNNKYPWEFPEGGRLL